MACARSSSLSSYDCSICKRTRKDYKKRQKEPEFFVVHISNAQVLSESLKKSEPKRKKLKEIEKIVCALRNNDGGDILIHLADHEPHDKYLGHFDDFLDSSLKNLIPDGKRYIDTYTRHWLCDVPGFESHSNVIVLKVSKTLFVSTLDFKTKISTDFGIYHPSTINIVSILYNKTFPERSNPDIKGIQEDTYGSILHENRRIQLKLFMPPKEKDVSTLVNFVDFVWNDMKFKEHLTTFSKVKGGGSIFVGIGETKDKDIRYFTKYVDPVGFEVRWSVDEIKSTLRSKVHEEASVLSADSSDGTLQDFPTELIDVACHPLQNSNIVLEIAVGGIPGIVFYEKKGPETYTIKDGKICRMDVKEWYRRISRMLIDQVVM